MHVSQSRGIMLVLLEFARKAPPCTVIALYQLNFGWLGRGSAHSLRWEDMTREVELFSIVWPDPQSTNTIDSDPNLSTLIETNYADLVWLHNQTTPDQSLSLL